MRCVFIPFGIHLSEITMYFSKQNWKLKKKKKKIKLKLAKTFGNSLHD